MPNPSAHARCTIIRTLETCTGTRSTRREEVQISRKTTPWVEIRFDDTRTLLSSGQPIRINKQHHTETSCFDASKNTTDWKKEKQRWHCFAGAVLGKKSAMLRSFLHSCVPNEETNGHVVCDGGNVVGRNLAVRKRKSWSLLSKKDKAKKKLFLKQNGGNIQATTTVSIITAQSIHHRSEQRLYPKENDEKASAAIDAHLTGRGRLFAGNLLQ
jgi:hypothetical protein